MAQRRMFSKTILRTDKYMELPVSSRDLYVQLNMDADDDGFVGNPRMTMKICSAGMTDLRLLEAAKFIMMFESGVICIKHWRINNELKGDRYKPTTYIRERDLVKIKENNAYSLTEGEPMMVWKQTGNKLFPQSRVDKSRVDKVSTSTHEANFMRVWSSYPRKVGKQAAKRWWDRHSFSEEEVQAMLTAIEKYKKTDQWQKNNGSFIPHPSTWLNRGSWEDEIVEDAKQPEVLFKSYAKK